MGPKAARRDASEQKTNRPDAIESKIPHRDTGEPKTPRRVDLYDDDDLISPRKNAYHQANNEKQCDKIYDEFELTGGNDEELEDVPWRKPKSNPSKSQKLDDNTTDKMSFGKWFDAGKSRAKEQVRHPPMAEATFQGELLDENYPNIKPSAVDKSSFEFAGRKPVKLFMEEKNKKTEQVISEQHVFALDDSPEHSPVENRRVLDDDVIIVSEDTFNDTVKSNQLKQAPAVSQPSQNQQIPVLGARVEQQTKTKPLSNPASSLPPSCANVAPLFMNQMYSYRPPTSFVDVYSSERHIRPFETSSYIQPSVNNLAGPPAEFFIGTQPIRPVPPVTGLPFNNFNTAPPSTRSWIPSTNPALPSPLKAAVAPPLQRPTLSKPPPSKELGTRSTPVTTPKDVVKEETRQQNLNLLAQKREYVERMRLLMDEMVKLKNKKKELLEGRKTEETEQFLKENNRLQTEIQSKITAVENVIDMLTNMMVKNGGEPKTQMKNADSQIESAEPKDDNSQKSLPTKNKKVMRDRCSRSRSSSRRRTRSRSLKGRRRLPSKSRSRSRSRQRSKSRRRSMSRSPRRHRSRRSRSQDRLYESQRMREKRSKSITSRQNHGQKSSSPVTQPKTPLMGQANVDTTVDRQRETQVAAGKKEESTKSGANHYNKKPKLEANLPQKKIEEGTKTSKPETNALVKTASQINRQKQINYVYYDSETHWCRVCNVFPQTAKEYLVHLHSVEHKTEITNQNLVDYPWHKVQPEMKKTSPDAPIERVPIRGLQFFVSATAWYCKLCDVFMGDLHCASVHLKSDQHEQNLCIFLSERPSWEDEWLKDRTTAYEEYSRKICDSQADEFTCAPPSVIDNNSSALIAPALQKPSPNWKESKAVNFINGDSCHINANHIREIELRSRPSDRRERSKSRERGRSRSRSRGRRTTGRNRSKGRYHSRDRNQSRDRGYSRGREHSRDRNNLRNASERLERPKYDKSVSAPKYHESNYSRHETNFSRENSRNSNDNTANAKILIETDANRMENDDRFVNEWIPSVRSTGKEKEFADLRDELRRKEEDEKNCREKERKDEYRSKDNKRHPNTSPSRTMSPVEKYAKKADPRSKSNLPSVKMQPIVIGKSARFPFIGKMPSKSYRKSDPNLAQIEKVVEMATNFDKKVMELEECVKQNELEPDLCNTVVDMDVNDVEDVPIVMEIADEIAVRNKDFDETLKILYSEKKPSESQPTSLQPTTENGNQNYLLSLFRSTMLETMKQLPKQRGSFDSNTVTDLVTTMSKTLLTVGQNAQNDLQPQMQNDRRPIESREKTRYRTDPMYARKRVESSRRAVTEKEEWTTKKNAMSQQKRRNLKKIREKLEEQEKQLQRKIDETKRNLEVESIPVPPEKEITRDSIPVPTRKIEMNNPKLSCESKYNCDLLLLGIEEGDSAALQF